MSLRDLYEQYHDRVQFLVIYIREAHPEDGWSLGKLAILGRLLGRFSGPARYVQQGVYDPQTIEERRKLAGTCQVALQYGIRTYVDEMDDAVMTAYAALPDRLYLVDTEGRVVYAGGLGPWGFKPAELKEAIDDLLSQESEAETERAG